MDLHTEYMMNVWEAYNKHPEVESTLVDIIENACLTQYLKSHSPFDHSGLEYKRFAPPSKIDIINNFEYYKNLCQEELWDMLNKESRYLIEEALKHISILAYRPSYDDIASCINDKEAIKKHKYHCEVLLRKGKRNQVLINSLK